MTVSYNVEVITDLPRLAWVAAIDRRTLATHLRCGRDVETQPEFAVEGAWEGDFVAGRFDASAHLFGSGVRHAGDAVLCCASSALVDRLVYAEDDRRVLCSNSLPLLLAAAGARLDDGHDYTASCRALMAGRRRYARTLHACSSRAGLRFGQVYGENLRVSAEGVVHQARPDALVHLENFDRYAGAVQHSLARLCTNLRHARRRIPTGLMTTVSSGYDSAASAVLGMAQGVKTCFTTSPATHASLEDGATVARALGLDPILLSRDAPDPRIELALLSATLDGRESVFAPMAAWLQDRPGLTALLTGYHGDKLWSRDTHGPWLSPEVMRGDTSGLNLSEARLHAGFVNLPVPFLYASRIAEIVAISNTPEMAAWRLGNDYDRPIPRRIVESAGVSRTLFGQRKSVVMDYRLWPRNEALGERLRAYLRARHGYGRIAHLAHELAGIVDYRLGALHGGNGTLSMRARLWPAQRQLSNRIFVWAVNLSADELAAALR